MNRRFKSVVLYLMYGQTVSFFQSQVRRTPVTYWRVWTVDRRHKDTYISALHTIASCVYVSNYPSLSGSCLWKSHKTFVHNRLHI